MELKWPALISMLHRFDSLSPLLPTPGALLHDGSSIILHCSNILLACNRQNHTILLKRAKIPKSPETHQKSPENSCVSKRVSPVSKPDLLAFFGSKTGGGETWTRVWRHLFPGPKVSTSMDLNPWSPMKPFLTNVERRGGGVPKTRCSTVDIGWMVFVFIPSKLDVFK